jgi:hypothetical protein
MISGRWLAGRCVSTIRANFGFLTRNKRAREIRP